MQHVLQYHTVVVPVIDGMIPTIEAFKLLNYLRCKRCTHSAHERKPFDLSQESIPPGIRVALDVIMMYMLMYRGGDARICILWRQVFMPL